MDKIFLIFIPLFIFSCSNKPEGFTIEGKVSYLPDSTLVVLIDNSTQSVLDSTYLINENFVLSGKVEHPKIGVLSFDRESFSRIWVENNEMSFSVIENDFANPVIKGSISQNESDDLDERLIALKGLRDSVMQIFLNPNIPDSVKSEAFPSSQPFLDSLNDREAVIVQDFIREFSGSYVSGFLLDIYKQTYNIDTVRDLYSDFSNELKASENGKNISKYISNYESPLEIGAKAHNIIQSNDEGQLIELKDSLGKYTLVEFWASWCLPCRESNPELVKMYKLYAPQGFEIYGVSLDMSEKRWLDAIEKDGLPWMNVSDLKGRNNEAALLYGVTAIPDNFLLDENGIVIARGLRKSALRNKLKEIFD